MAVPYLLQATEPAVSASSIHVSVSEMHAQPSYCLDLQMENLQGGTESLGFLGSAREMPKPQSC